MSYMKTEARFHTICIKNWDSFPNNLSSNWRNYTFVLAQIIGVMKFTCGPLGEILDFFEKENSTESRWPTGGDN